ncbi:hypothetical protein EDEG_01019 [Edhazardia aedis USNM 41457]|uniref:Uncharacterized protein n=1 Tax=Edhazardia aedis (strain USNM 41457) TaxID=1003232 RepID=J9DU22_EDHAE|nr:hypothetical protein EDEG_01019 [Edhazardia aedis USNM 41457]|eukprot:EJW04797.1 hypothetical protein EDEG_01019 [Edhazardia aedis USNM 41457]
MKFQSNHTSKTLIVKQAIRFVPLFYLYADFARMASQEIESDMRCSSFFEMISLPVSTKNPKADIIEKIMKLKKTAENIRDGDIQNDISLFSFKACQYQSVLKEHAKEAVMFYSSMLDDNDKINTESLKKVLDLQQFMIEAQAYEPNPLTSCIVFKTRINSIDLFNIYLRQKEKELIEIPLESPHYISEVFNDFDNIIRKMAGPFPDRYDLINKLAGPMIMALLISKNCTIL